MRASFAMESASDTQRFGELLASLLAPKDVVGLRGDLGAGKTFLCGAVVHALGCPEAQPVTSPTFTLIKEYETAPPVYHMDLYRLGGVDELYDLGLWEYYDGAGICLVEWCDRFDDLWPTRALVLSLTLGSGERRTIDAEGVGRGAELAGALARLWPSADRRPLRGSSDDSESGAR